MRFRREFWLPYGLFRGHHEGPDGAFLRATGAFDRCHKKTLDLNQIDNVTLHHAVAGAKSGKAHLKRTNAENSGMAEFRPGAGDRSVDMLPVDDVVGDAHVTGVKIDVEGMQMPVLRGMSKTIRRCAPVLWLELRPAKGEIEQPSEWLAKRGYKRSQMSFRDFLFTPETSA